MPNLDGYQAIVQEVVVYLPCLVDVNPDRLDIKRNRARCKVSLLDSIARDDSVQSSVTKANATCAWLSIALGSTPIVVAKHKCEPTTKAKSSLG